MVNGFKHCWNLHDSTFIVFVDHCEKKISLKKFVLLICKILGLFVNTLTPDGKVFFLIETI